MPKCIESGKFKFKYDGTEYDLADSLVTYETSTAVVTLNNYEIKGKKITYTPYNSLDNWTIEENKFKEFFSDEIQNIPNAIKCGSKPCFDKNSSFVKKLTGSNVDLYYVIEKDGTGSLNLYSTDEYYNRKTFKYSLDYYDYDLNRSIVPDRIIIILQAAGGGGEWCQNQNRIAGSGGGSGAVAFAILNTNISWGIKLGAYGLGARSKDGATNADFSAVTPLNISDNGFVCYGGKAANAFNGGLGGQYSGSDYYGYRNMFNVHGFNGAKGGDIRDDWDNTPEDGSIVHTNTNIYYCTNIEEDKLKQYNAYQATIKSGGKKGEKGFKDKQGGSGGGSSILAAGGSGGTAENKYGSPGSAGGIGAGGGGGSENGVVDKNNSRSFGGDGGPAQLIIFTGNK